MKMHDEGLDDPLISQPEPVTLLLPILENSLTRAGIKTARKEITSRFMEGHPRVAILYGSRDHPAHLYDDRIAREAVRYLWQKGALPFEIIRPSVCDGIAQGHLGMTVSLASRNLSTLNTVTQFFAHGYDAALVLSGCDKQPPGELAGLIEVDLARKKLAKSPLYAVFLPSNIMPAGRLTRDIKKGFLRIRTLLNPEDKKEMDALLDMSLMCNTYVMFKRFIDTLVGKGIISRRQGEFFTSRLAIEVCRAGGTCPFLGTGNTNKFVLAALGLVSRGNELLPHPASKGQVRHAADNLLECLRSRREDLRVSALVKKNLANAVTVWSAVGGSSNWVLHFPYIAVHLGIKLRPSYIEGICKKTPYLLQIGPILNKSVFTLAKGCQNGRISGIDTLMKVLYNRGLIKDAPTVDGCWKTRIGRAKAADNRLIHSNPLRPRSGVIELKGNFCQSAILKVTGMTEEALTSFDKKVYYAVSYLGEKEAGEGLIKGDHVLRKLRDSVNAKEFIRVSQLNPDSKSSRPLKPQSLPKERLFANLIEKGLLKVMVVIAGEGPRARGIPEMYYPSEYLNRDPVLRRIAALLTDGRFSGATYGPCIGHCSPEAFLGGGIAAIITGDLIFIDLKKGRINLVDKKELLRTKGKLPLMSTREVSKRPIIRQRIRQIAALRSSIPPSMRNLWEGLSSTTEGVVPLNLEYYEEWK